MLCSPSLTSSCRWDTWRTSTLANQSVCRRPVSATEIPRVFLFRVSHLLIGHVELGRELLFQVVELLLEAVALLLQRQALDLKLLTHFLQRKDKKRMTGRMRGNFVTGEKETFECDVLVPVSLLEARPRDSPCRARGGKPARIPSAARRGSCCSAQHAD